MRVSPETRPRSRVSGETRKTGYGTMTAIIADHELEQELIRRRQETGADRWDEVWEGVYVMNPLPNPEHQRIVARLGSVLSTLFDFSGLGRVYPGINYASNAKDWQHDYRCPDVAIFLNDNPDAQEHDAFYTGAADFFVEVVSPDDRVREKIPFYEKLGVYELLIVDRDPWQLELFRDIGGKLASAAVSTVENGTVIETERLSVTFQLVPGKERPGIRVVHPKSNQEWVV